MRRRLLVRPGANWSGLCWRALKLLLIALVAAAPISNAAFAKKNKHSSQNHHQNDFGWRVRNKSGEVVNLQIYSQTRQGQVWPGVGRVWIVPPDGKTYVDPISCEKGEKICYGAWTQRDIRNYWGMGEDGKQSCSNCCYICGGFSQVIGFDQRTMSIARPAAPAVVEEHPETGPELDDQPTAPVAAPVVPAAPSPRVQVSCGDELAAARRIATGMTVSVDRPSNVVAGAKIGIKWTGGSTTGIPTYLIVDAPAEVRFSGTNFVALTPGARAPFAITHTANRARAFVPLHRGTIASGGDFSVIPERAGEQEIGWAIVSAGSCGETVLAQGSTSRFIASIGAPKIVVQDRFADDEPLKRFRHTNGRYDLLVFKDRYEVRDAETDELILARAGTDPNFSPTGRFVAARRDGDRKLEVLDVVSGDLVETFSGIGGESNLDGLLAWVLNDSIVIYTGAHSQYASTGYALTLGGDTGADGPVNKDTLDKINSGYLSKEDSGMAGSSLIFSGSKLVQCWDDCQVILDVDRGFIAVIAEGDGVVRDIFAREQDSINAPVTNDGIIDVSARGRLYQRIREHYGFDVASAPKHWNLGESIVLSHSELVPDWWLSQSDLADWVASAKTQAKFVRHFPEVKQSGKVAVAGANTGRMLRGVSSGRQIAVEQAGPKPVAELTMRKVGDALGRSLAPNQGATEEEFHMPDHDNTSSDAVEAALEKYRMRTKVLTDRIIKDNPSFAKVLDPKGQPFHYPSAEGFESTFIEKGWSWSDQVGTIYLLRVDEQEGCCHHGSIFFVSSSATTDAGQALLAEGSTEDTSPLGETAEETSIISVFPVTGANAFILAASATRTAALIDETTGKRIGAIIKLTDAGLLRDLRLTEDGKFVVQLNKDDRFFVTRVSDGELVLQGADVDDEIVVMTPDGRYDTTYEGAESLQVSFPGLAGLRTIHQFESALFRPGLAAAVLDGKPVAPRPDSLGAPPTLEFQLNQKSDGGKLHGTIKAEASGGLARINLYLDGRLIEEKPLTGKTAATDVDIPDPGGARWVTAVVFDSAGLASRPSMVHLPAPVRPEGTLRAVLVGIGAFPNLPAKFQLTSAFDAKSLGQMLMTSKTLPFETTSVKTLIDAEASEDAILAAIREAVEATTPNDTALFFLADHGFNGSDFGGTPGLMLGLSTTKLDNLPATSLSWSKLTDLIDKARGRVVVVLDTCQSGLAGNQTFATNDDFAALLTSSSAPIVVLAASKGREFSNEAPQGAGGLFTTTVVAALTDKRGATDLDGNGVIDLSELYRAVKGPVASVAHQIQLKEPDVEHEQTPWLARNTLVGEMSLF